MNADELAELTAAAARLTSQLDQVEATRDEALLAANAAGASQHELAEATGLSRAAVQRRLAANGVTAPSPTRSARSSDDDDEELREWRWQMREAQLKRANLELAAAAQKVKIRSDAARAIDEANQITRITADDLGYPTPVGDE